MNFKKILLGSTIAAASFGLFACGDDSSSGGDIQNPDIPDLPEIDTPKPSSLSPVIFSGVNITVTAGINGMRGSLSGMIKLDPEFVNPEVPYTPEAVTMIDSVGFAVGRVIDGKAYQEKININTDGIVFPTERVAFSQKIFEFSELSGCGEFKFYIFAYSSTKEADLETSIYTSVHDSLTFVRPEQECQAALPVESSSSAAVVCTPVTAHEFTLSNSMGTSQSSINFETGLADNPHISVRFANNAAYITAGAGVAVYEDNKQTTGLEAQPKNGQAQICSEDFGKSNFQFEEELTSGVWLDVVTADGKVFPVMVKKVMFESATKGTVDIIYYN